MLNKAILMGRLTRDPELRHTASNIPVTSFSLAVDRNYGKGAERQTDFIDCVAWRSTAEFISRYFVKGQMMALVGSIQTRKWEDKDGNKRVSVEVVADEVSFADSKKDREGAAGRESAYSAGFDAPLTGTSDFQELSDDDGELPF